MRAHARTPETRDLTRRNVPDPLAATATATAAAANLPPAPPQIPSRSPLPFVKAVQNPSNATE